jgi:hypothetical protein
MSYVAQLHHVTPENEIIFWLLCYCQAEQWSQARSSAFDILWIAGRDLTYGEVLPWLRDIIAGFALFPFLRDPRAKDGQCAWCLCGKMMGHVPRG